MRLTIYQKIIVGALILFVIYLIAKREREEKDADTKNDDSDDSDGNDGDNGKHPYDPIPAQTGQDEYYAKNRLQKSELIGQSYATK